MKEKCLQENVSEFKTDQHVRTQKTCSYKFVRAFLRMNNALERLSIVGKSVKWEVKEEQGRQSAPSKWP